jgi:hypothetical protein
MKKTGAVERRRGEGKRGADIWPLSVLLGWASSTIAGKGIPHDGGGGVPGKRVESTRHEGCKVSIESGNYPIF